ncbi:ABC transporter ATP-binding protein [Fusibacter paucivorans]|uniref:ABC transporter ATP-binding protein n=1 Tax=Fusibacter paucivorans TaxID=76009 RepID=A0ABS5PNT1_9FIRM|nr:ABC transporter ATP-binding protein [Fusibacter paucivorans]MBS7525707.1 ABC transporter ATP-binding protein [Fusibacter paucivorans]
MNNILEVHALNKTYKNFALQDVTFSLQEDCITGFIGINGAGKTTTIRSILGLALKNSGKIKVLGMDVDTHEREIKDALGVVMDEGCFYNQLTLNEMKSIIAPAYTKWSDNDYRHYLQAFDLDPKQKIATLSKGMRMKYSLVLALSHQAQLLIMDEPTSGLDPLVRSQLLEIMADYMKQGGKGVFFSTHITSDLDKIADMLILIDHGKIVFEKSKDELLDQYRLVKGDPSLLSNEHKKHLMNLELTSYGFSGITADWSKIQKSIPDIVLEKVDVEAIMLAYLKRRNSNA